MKNEPLVNFSKARDKKQKKRVKFPFDKVVFR